MPTCFFAADLHGKTDRYDKLLASIANERPDAVFLGGDLLPHVSHSAAPEGWDDFISDYLVPVFRKTRNALGETYPDIFLILGNDDARREESDLLAAEAEGLCHYIHARKYLWEGFVIYGFAYVPPTPFLLKDWELYDVSRHVPPGSLSPEEGFRTVPVENNSIKWATIQEELARLAANDPLDRAIFLFHVPPCDTALDRAALDGRFVEGVPLDCHVGSVAVRRFIEERQPLLTLHGHVHEAARLSGEWKIHLGRTVCVNAAHDGPELALVRFDPACPAAATRELL